MKFCYLTISLHHPVIFFLIQIIFVLSHLTFLFWVELSQNFTHILWLCAKCLVHFICFWLGTHAWTSFSINCLWNCYKTQSKYKCKSLLFYNVLTTLMLVSLVELSKNFTHILWSCAIYSGLFHRFLVRNSCVNVVTQKLFLKLLQNSIKVPMGKLKPYLCRENIDFFEDFKYVNESTDEHS